MKTAHSIAGLQHFGISEVVIACGVFDGVHRGHRHLIATLLEQAKASGATPVVVTFDPHPRSVLQPQTPPQHLTSVGQKLRLLKELGIEATVLLPFSESMAVMSAEDFVERELLRSPIRVRGICVGSQWRFGCDGHGDIAFLQHKARDHHFSLYPVPEVIWHRRPVSSTRIRQAIQQGRLRHAARMLTRPYCVSGKVVAGKGIGGRQVHVPTANLADPRILLPPCGVYAARGLLNPQLDHAPRICQGIVYIGHAPTFLTDQADLLKPPVLELHLFDFTEDIYGMTIDVEFHDYIRPDQTFPSVEALRGQIRRDIDRAKHILGLN